jgi:hypothetical protein
VGTGYSGSRYMQEADDEEEEDDDLLLLAKAFFDMREYRRAAHALQGSTHKKAFFLRCYATYLVRFFFCLHANDINLIMKICRFDLGCVTHLARQKCNAESYVRLAFRRFRV